MLSQAFKKEIFSMQHSGIREEEPMRAHTSFHIGGPAELFIEPESKEILASLVRLCRQEDVPFYVIGAGSNLLVGDRGVRGVVVKMGAGLDFLECDGTNIMSGSGVQLSKLANFAAKNSLSGLEFAGGIPGTVGGAIFMNAGAYGGEMKDVVVQTEYLDDNGEIRKMVGEAHEFAYRDSIFTGGGKYILSTQVSLVPKAEEEIRVVMKELAQKRREKQPLDYPSAGSTFKRPEGYFAAKLIEDAGLKGLTVGGAQVSEKHAGFVINKGDATAADVCALVEAIKEKVFTAFGVQLCTEIKMLGEF